MSGSKRFGWGERKGIKEGIPPPEIASGKGQGVPPPRKKKDFLHEITRKMLNFRPKW